MISVTVPIRLVSEANQREHWAKKAKRVKGHRWAVMLHLRAQPKRKPPLPVTVLLTRIAPRRLDDDNAISAQKGCRDSVAEWLGVNDRSPLVTWRYAQEQRSKVYAVRIEITPATAEGGTT